MFVSLRPFEEHEHQTEMPNRAEGGQMGMLKGVRNVLGTVGLLFAGYILVVSLKDSLRYIKISTM